MLHISSLAAKTPSHSGSDGAHISVSPGLRRKTQEAECGKSPVNELIETNSTETEMEFAEFSAQFCVVNLLPTECLTQKAPLGESSQLCSILRC